MDKRNFVQEVTYRNRELGLRLCVGLDTDNEKAKFLLGEPNTDLAVTLFNQDIIDATKDVACVYKANLWFYLSGGYKGMLALEATVDCTKSHDIPIIVDAKFGDIGSTSGQAAKFLFNVLGADATTANPYLGQDAVQPLLDRSDHGVIFICKTSNPDSAEIQDRRIDNLTLEQQEIGALDPGLRVWQLVALRVANHWNVSGNCGLVIGATYPEELALCRQLVGPDLPILIPGVGKQGGDLEASVKAGIGPDGLGVIMLNVSSAITGASTGDDFAEAAGRKAEEYDRDIQAAVAEATIKTV